MQEKRLPLRRPANPVFARGAPLATAVIAMRALARKGVTQPGPGLRKLIRLRLLAQYLGAQEKRGLVIKVGVGKTTRRKLA